MASPARPPLAEPEPASAPPAVPCEESARKRQRTKEDYRGILDDLKKSGPVTLDPVQANNVRDLVTRCIDDYKSCQSCWKKEYEAELAKKLCSKCKQPRAVFLCSEPGCAAFLCNNCAKPHSCANSLCPKRCPVAVFRFCEAHDDKRLTTVCSDCLFNACSHCGKSGFPGILYPCNQGGCVRFTHGTPCSLEPMFCAKHPHSHGTYFICRGHRTPAFAFACGCAAQKIAPAPVPVADLAKLR